jgi:hypothetical protein
VRANIENGESNTGITQVEPSIRRRRTWGFPLKVFIVHGAAQGGSMMLNKTWSFVVALALAAAPVSSLLAAAPGAAA